MCGLAGFFRNPGTPERSNHEPWLQAMGQAIVHRGPDAGAIYLDDRIGLCHRRLSILDLSDAGTQPMVSTSGRYVIVFNGEIYNFAQLRRELEQQGVVFHTRTDTEVLLELYERRGEACLERLNGMFAFAIWDRQGGELFMARDRLGKKPLYYWFGEGQLAFASEIKALLELPFFRPALRPDAVKDFFAYQYVPDPKTIYQDVFKLEPGCWLKTDGLNTITGRYWELSFHPLVGRSVGQIEDELFGLIDEAVCQRMISDVPLGAFLSGGVDSSAVVGLMAGHAPRPVTTCAIGFDSERFDEVHYARQVAQQFGTDHHEFTVRDNVAERLESIARYFDEPFADASFVPTWFVSQLARQQVTVALAGDGGDENFAGYSKYQTDAVENRLRSLVPGTLRHHLLPPLAGIAGCFRHTLTNKAQTLMETLAQEPDTGFFMSNCFFRQSVWDRLVTPEFAASTRDYDPADVTRKHYREAPADDHLSRILYTDIKTYLPGDILVKVDRMSMANSLETRAPLLDYRVVEYAASIPAGLKLRGKEGKAILKSSFRRLLPDDILYRKKMGFSVPLAQWLRREIRPLADELLTDPEGGLARCFDMGEVKKLWQSHLDGNDRHTQELWSMVAFALWWRNYGGHLA
ncbi:asparagine synthase (glutamine-hydrolyzing) [Marinobacter persicus]|uniref:asparagine synthase (glutamine-hydrolyzing) n=1 Tax=Marinobacter persicus TaxID=930118 RepID=A0A2S6G9B6_9GAMM|nr:asparagine synthase (glutamine-hydrolyzing) [Marinobacter persicus]PPK52729.1 asparagine synthase (glutamine-hydrolysing) [Marinobacter persicus]PPK55725.1 asparagine synthase (glutamine-hydrolysing) [Marinobacter persicus]PPK59240.1 asparagine synthase (glutamine-hydrolysing) [Marinobacter persicus]